jgi:hypothetical protein
MSDDESSETPAHTPEPDPLEVLKAQTAAQAGEPGIPVAVPRPRRGARLPRGPRP